MRFWKKNCAWAALLWAACGTAWAENSSGNQNSCDVENGKHVLWENDVFTGKLFGRSDKWYTNGIKFYSSDKPDCIPGYLPDFLGERIKGLGDGGAYAIQTGSIVGQLMFTPKNLTMSVPQPMDRFWGGWLYAGIVVQRQPYDAGERGKKNREEMETLELDIGVTGPVSGAEQVQRAIHVATHSTMPHGWGNQIGTEAGIQLSYVRMMRVWKYPAGSDHPHLDFSWHYGGAAGTLFDHVNGGFTFRFGGRLTDAAPNVIESPSIGQFKEVNDALYFLTRLDMKGVIHNTFIDGSLFREASHTSHLNSKHLVPQLTFGGVMEWNNGNKNAAGRG